MHKTEYGFSHILLPILVVAVVIIGGSYLVHRRDDETKSNTSDTTTTVATVNKTASTLPTPANESTVSGVAGDIDSIAASLSSSDATLGTQYNANDQTSDASLGSAATNLEGAYNASIY